MSTHAIDVTKEELNALIINSEVPVLLDVWAPWCKPCVALAPTLEAVAEKSKKMLKVVKLNADIHMEAANELKVRSIPALILFKNGEELKRHFGSLTFEELSRWIKESETCI